jgi:hypothetical protein
VALKHPRIPAAVLLATALALAACGERQAARNDTSVMGSAAPAAPRAADPPELTDGSGAAIPAPDVRGATELRMARSGDTGALAVWVQGGDVFTAMFERGRGWSAPQPLEQIFGEASDPRIAGNANGQAMAVWRHTVGSIQSLRFSRFEPATGWSGADVVPGAMPRPHAGGAGADHDALQLEMDARGNVTARWPSGFDADQMQVARYAAGEGWSRALSEPLAAAPAGPAAPAAR